MQTELLTFSNSFTIFKHVWNDKQQKVCISWEPSAYSKSSIPCCLECLQMTSWCYSFWKICWIYITYPSGKESIGNIWKEEELGAFSVETRHSDSVFLPRDACLRPASGFSYWSLSVTEANKKSFCLFLLFRGERSFPVFATATGGCMTDSTVGWCLESSVLQPHQEAVQSHNQRKQ